MTGPETIWVLVIYDDLWHPAEVIHTGLQTMQEADIVFDYVQDAKDILTSDQLQQYHVIMNCKCNNITAANCHPWFDPGVTEVGPAEFASYVRWGGGFLSVHSGNAFYPEPDSREYIEFVDNNLVRHPPRCDVLVSPVGTHPITEGVAPFIIRDEHYELAVIAPDARQILKTESPSGGCQEGGYVRNLGNGRLCVLTPGHVLGVWQHPAYQKLLAQAIRWCAGRL